MDPKDKVNIEGAEGALGQEMNEIQAPDLSHEEMKMPENSSASPATTTERKAPVSGIIIAILAVLLILILGGMCYWFSQLTTQAPVAPTPVVERPTAEENNEPESTTAEAAVETQAVLSTSDEIVAIEADIEATDLDALDAELTAIDAELEAALSENF